MKNNLITNQKGTYYNLFIFSITIYFACYQQMLTQPMAEKSIIPTVRFAINQDLMLHPSMGRKHFGQKK